MKGTNIVRLRTLRAYSALAIVGGCLVAGTTSPPALAVTEPSQVLVTSQYGGAGCANNQRLIVANPFTGGIVTGGNLGTPNSAFDVFNEAKPYANNTKIVALWGGSNTTTQRGGVGVYDRIAGQWTTQFFLPTNFAVGGTNAHSITVLPDGWFAVALTGTIGGQGSGFVVLFSPTGTKGNQYALTSAHGIEYDPRNGGNVYAVGMSSVVKYTYSTTAHTLTQVASYPLPGGAGANGHDLRRRRNDNKYSVTADGGTYVFDPATGGFTNLTKTDGTILTGVKSVDQRFDGLVEYNYFDNDSSKVDSFFFLDGSSHPTTFCTNVYKAGRWLYDVGTPDFNDGGSPTPTWSPTFTVGGGANSWWIEIYASSDVVSLDVIGKNGQFFMANLPKQTWGAFAQSPPQEMTAGSLIKLIGRRADGSSAGSITFPWLQDSNPDTETGWNASFTIQQCGPTMLEATISAAAAAAKVRIGTADWAVMTKNQVTGRWERLPGVPAGTKYLIRAYLAPGTEADPQSYDLIRTC